MAIFLDHPFFGPPCMYNVFFLSVGLLVTIKFHLHAIALFHATFQSFVATNALHKL